jgi:hypothetical protein
MVNGKMVEDMVRVYLLIQIEMCIVDGGLLEKNLGRVLTYMLILI